MNADEYLGQVRRGLKGLMPEEQEKIIAELASHIESGQEDSSRKEEQTMAEMGTPKDMGKGFHSVYRPNRWVDFLLIIVPIYLITPLLAAAYWRIAGPAIDWNQEIYMGMSIRFALLIALVMTIVAAQRRSLLLFAFWSPDALARLITLITREQRWQHAFDPVRGGMVVLESLLYLAVLLGIFFWLMRTVWMNRTNYLIVIFALQPLIGTLVGWATTSYGLANGIIPQFPNWRMGVYNVQIVIEVLCLAGFVLLRPRDLRWLFFFIGMVYYGVIMVVAYWPNLVPVGLWLLYVTLVAILWGLDLTTRRHFDLEDGHQAKT